MTLIAVARALVLALGAWGASAAVAADNIVPAGKNDKGYATGDMVLGKADAPLTLIEYASMTCPHCAHFHAEELPGLKTNYIETGKLRLVFREFPLDGMALRGAMLARCSGPDRYFTFIDVLFKGQGIWARPQQGSPDPLAELQKLAKLGGIGEEQFRACMADQALQNEIAAARLNGEKTYNISATPGFVLNGKKLENVRPTDAVAAALGVGVDVAPVAATTDQKIYWIAGGAVGVVIIAGGAFWWSRRNRGASRA